MAEEKQTTYAAFEISQEGYEMLHKAVDRTGPKLRFWYSGKNIPFLASRKLTELEIIDQTGATSDYDKLEIERRREKNRENTTRVVINSSGSTGTGFFGRLFGRRDLEVQVYNPTITASEIKAGDVRLGLIGIESLAYGVYQGGVNFETRLAHLLEEDQDVAHVLGLKFAPAHVVERDPLVPSNQTIHSDRPKVDDQGNLIVYCDNLSCKKRVRNPVVVIEPLAGGVYHNETCWSKDALVKHYLGVQGLGFVEVSLDETLRMFKEGELQQSPNSKKPIFNLRNLDPFPEAVMILPH